MQQKRHLTNLIISRAFASNLNPNFTSSNITESKAQQIVNAEIKSGANPVPVFKRAVLNGSKVAVRDANGDKTYTELLAGSFKLSKQISNICGENSK